MSTTGNRHACSATAVLISFVAYAAPTATCVPAEMASVMCKASMGSRIAGRPVAAKQALRRPVGRRAMSVSAFKITLKTPSGDKSIECADDTYILVRD